MSMPPPSDFAQQQRLIEALRNSACYPHPAKQISVQETHLSWVVLAGNYAYKIKKALDLGFADFTRLGERRFYCEEEVRLNSRLAPKLYLGVVHINAGPEHPVIDSPASAALPLDYAVKMRRFPSDQELGHVLERGQLLPRHIDSLANTLACFHQGLRPATPEMAEFAHGKAAGVARVALDNFSHFRQIPAPHNMATDVLAAIKQATQDEIAAQTEFFAQRHAQGFIRECHGDLHLANIVLIKDTPVPFDGIEFNPALRWIDVINDAAFLVMDLLLHEQAGLAYRFLNAYLEITGDYHGLHGLRFYVAYRAMVRAKVNAIRAGQDGSDAAVAMQAYHAQLALAERVLRQRRCGLIITHGLPGSGKSTFALQALERLHAIRIRSDVERKRLFGLPALADSHAALGGTGIYHAEAGVRTYAHLAELARGMLGAGLLVIVDAAFLKQTERTQFRRIAESLGVPFVIASVSAHIVHLRERITRRHAKGGDASEADLAVLELLQNAQEPLTQEELCDVVGFESQTTQGKIEFAAEAWREVEKLLGLPLN